MKTTLNIIRSKSPCSNGWNTLLKSLNKTKADDEPLDLIDILNSNGIKDAIWCLCCFDYRDYCLFLADIAESVLPIYESKYPDNTAPRKAIEAIRNYHTGNITKEQLKKAAYADAAYGYAAAYAAADAAYAAASAAASAYAASAYAASAKNKKWQEIEQMFIKHFK